jgi:hypothetical protein
MISLSLSLLAVGCKPTAAGDGAGEGDSGSSTGPVRKVVKFEGAADPKFAGTWKTDKESSVLDLRKDGSLTITSMVRSPRGTVKSSFDGKWLVSGEDLLLQYSAPKQGEMTIEYPAQLTGNEMTLDQGSRSKMTYKRQPDPAAKK